jgi:hypothetical protein
MASVGWGGGSPAVFALVPKRIANNRKVNEALLNMRWNSDFQGALSLTVLLEYFELYQLLQEVVLQPGTSDSHIWRLSASEQYSAKSAYKTLFQGAIAFEPAERVWKTWAPREMQIFHVIGGEQQMLDL